MRAFRLFSGLLLALGAGPALAQAPAAVAATPLSAWGMFLGADMVVQAVMVGLMAASVATWTVWLAKALEIRAMRRQVAAAFDILAGHHSLAAAHAKLRHHAGPAAAMVNGAMDDVRPPAALHRAEERIATRLERQRLAAGRSLGRGTGILATIGATAPFIGLFGTVWGIMNSFVGIAQAQTTNLAVVAPGIAEALLATATGLVAAIPAVVAYNTLNRTIAAVKAALGDCAAEVRRLAAHDIDQGVAASLPLAAE